MTGRWGARFALAASVVGLAWAAGPCASGRPVLRAQELPEPIPPIATPAPTIAPGLPARPGRPAGAGGLTLLDQLRDGRADLRPPLVRVLLTVPQPPVFPQPGRRYAVWADGSVEVLRGPLAVRMEGAERPAFQVGAFRTRENAEGEAARLARAGFETEVRLGEGELFRVIVLARRGEGSDGLRARLTSAGVGSALRAEGGGGGLAVSGETGAEVRGRELRLLPFDADPVSVGDRVVRGELVLVPSARGVQVVNVLNLEEYLRGVVPVEMGPRAFPEIEALKAQAVAARTYTVTHLGGGGARGYDICDTQACQVYGGASAEHPLSDEAVRATAGLIATFAGAPIDAMYHSTCGGHTEAAAEQFPRRAAPYLVAVPCRGETLLALGPATASGQWLEVVGRLAEVGRRAAASLGVTAERNALAAALARSARSSPGREGLAAVFGLAEAQVLLGEQQRGRDDWVDGLLALFRLPVPPTALGSGREEEELALVVRLAQLSGGLEEVPGRIGAAGEFIAEDGRRFAVAGLGSNIMARSGAAWRPGKVATLPGAPATLWLMGERPLVLEVEERLEADAASPWSWWAREFAAARVAAACGVGDVEWIEVVSRGSSGRATVVGVRAGGVRKEMRGIDFRYALGLPDNRFVVLRQQRGKELVFRFLGRGWGHGVGMCQNGAYGLARGGATFEEILTTYYRGVQLSAWQASGPAGGVR